jgi:hypothetical protein
MVPRRLCRGAVPGRLGARAQAGGIGRLSAFSFRGSNLRPKMPQRCLAQLCYL